MAEYIDKKYLDRKFQIDMMCLWGGTIFDSQSIINSLPTADVIERSKYEQLDKEADALSKAYKEEHEKRKQLMLNIAKAREEIENEIKFWSEETTYPMPYTTEIRKAKANSYKHCLKILDKLIAEMRGNKEQ